MARQRVLITVKTYPTLSRKYGETVCTAGIRQDGSWMRIYPVPFRRLDEAQQYKKFDWIEADFVKARSDPRPESHHPSDMNRLVPVGHMGTSDKWRERRQLVLQTAKVYTKMAELISGAKANQISLAVFKPAMIKDLVIEEDEAQWDARKLDQMRNLHAQTDLFGDEAWRKTFQIIPKLPYAFSYSFVDLARKESTLQILDWEIGALYWNCYRRHGQNEKIALKKVSEKYEREFFQTDLHFFLGTTQQYHKVAPNPWVIIGVFPIPRQHQPELF